MGKVKKLPEIKSTTKTFTDERVIKVMAFILKNQPGVKSEEQFLKSIGYANTNNLALIRKGSQSFRIEHLVQLCEVYGVDANYLLNKKCIKIMAPQKKLDAMRNLKEAVLIVENHFNNS